MEIIRNKETLCPYYPRCSSVGNRYFWGCDKPDCYQDCQTFQRIVREEGLEKEVEE
jgi:hypothetical protein